MNPKKLERIIKLLRDNHVSHLKTLEFEISLQPSDRPFVPASDTKVTDMTQQVTQAFVSDPALPVENSIPHHVNEVANLLKLSDEALVDKLFPMPSAEPQNGAL